MLKWAIKAIKKPITVHTGSIIIHYNKCTTGVEQIIAYIVYSEAHFHSK